MLTDKDYCDYDTCVALEELGYPRYCYDNGGELDKILRMVTLYNAQKWLREDKNLHIDCGYNPSLSWYYYHVWKGQEEIAEGEAFPTYEDALKTAIYMATEFLKEEK